VTRSKPRWRSLAGAAALALGACTPRPPIPTIPVVVVPDTADTRPAEPATPAPRPPAVPDTAAFPEALLAPPVRVGLVVDTQRVEVGSAGAFTIATQDGRTVASVPGGGTATFTASGGTLSFTTRQASGSGGPGGAGLPAPLVVRSADPHGTLLVRGAPYRGEMLVQRATTGGGLTLVNRLDMENYLLGVVPKEIGRFDLDIYEAIKAQAVAARTYAVTYQGRRTAQGFDVYATVEDQVYGGVAGENEVVNRAVRETAGEILAYGGRPISAYYHSTCAGHTAAIEEVWNNAPVPYLVAVRDVDPRTGEAYDRSSRLYQWTERWTHEQLVGILNRTLADSLRGRRITQIRDMRVLQRTPSGRVHAMRIETDAGSFTVGKDRVRWILPPVRGGILNSSKFDVQLVRSGGAVSEIVATGGGWGHGIGMCQIGAMGRARAGQNYRTILGAYYPGAELQDLY
jgi:stage II sporulation protein D